MRVDVQFQNALREVMNNFQVHFKLLDTFLFELAHPLLFLLLIWNVSIQEKGNKSKTITQSNEKVVVKGTNEA